MLLQQRGGGGRGGFIAPLPVRPLPGGRGGEGENARNEKKHTPPPLFQFLRWGAKRAHLTPPSPHPIIMRLLVAALSVGVRKDGTAGESLGACPSSPNEPRRAAPPCPSLTLTPPPRHTILQLALAAPRPRRPYPVGTCAPSSSPQCFSACAGATCGAADATTAECGVLRYPSITHGKNKTHCLPDFSKTCADPGAAQVGCDRCALWGLMQAEGQCVDARAAGAADEAAAASPADCERHGWYVVMSAQEKDPDAVGGLCAAKDHWVRAVCVGVGSGIDARRWRGETSNTLPPPSPPLFLLFFQLVLPTHPCTGIESTDPLCTGPPAERVWAAAAVTTARDKGFLNNSTRRWGALMNAPPWRGQHQQHIHVAYLEEDPPKAQVRERRERRGGLGGGNETFGVASHYCPPPLLPFSIVPTGPPALPQPHPV